MGSNNEGVELVHEVAAATVPFDEVEVHVVRTVSSFVNVIWHAFFGEFAVDHQQAKQRPMNVHGPGAEMPRVPSTMPPRKVNVPETRAHPMK